MQSEALPSDEEMVKWAGIEYEGEIPHQLRKLIWLARTQGKRIAWRDVYQTAASQHDSYSLASVPLDSHGARSSGSAKG
jgi:hypothetical protein